MWALHAGGVHPRSTQGEGVVWCLESRRVALLVASLASHEPDPDAGTWMYSRYQIQLLIHTLCVQHAGTSG